MVKLEKQLIHHHHDNSDNRSNTNIIRLSLTKNNSIQKQLQGPAGLRYNLGILYRSANAILQGQVFLMANFSWTWFSYMLFPFFGLYEMIQHGGRKSLSLNNCNSMTIGTIIILFLKYKYFMREKT